MTPSRTSGTPPEPGVAWCTSSPPARFPTLLVVSPPWGDMSVPAFTVLSHTCTWHSHTRRWRAQPPVPATDPHSPRLSGLELSDTAGHGAPVGNAEWVWQLWPCFPREVVADSDCQNHQPWVPRAYWQRVKLALLWLFPLRPCRMAPGAWGTAGEGGGAVPGMVGRVWQLAGSYSQPHSPGVSRAAATPRAFLPAPSPSLNQYRVPELQRGVVVGAEQVQVVSASASFRGLCTVTTVAYIYKTCIY